MPNGLPALPFGVSVGIAIAQLLTGDIPIGFAGFSAPQWGIFLDGSPVILADIVATLDFRQSWSIADYPVEQGSFASYDKVATPFTARLRMATGGSEDDRTAFLDSIDAIAGDTNLYDIVTPERVYPSVNVESFEYRRTASNGLGILSVDITVIEIRDTGEASFSSTNQPSGSDVKDGGTVQPQTPTSSETSSTSDIQ